MIDLETDGCAGSDTEINYLEHVQAVITVSASRRGHLTAYLVSPSGTR